MRRQTIVVGSFLAFFLPATTAAAVTVDPTSKDFGAVTVGTTTATTSFTLTPTGDVSTTPLQAGPGTSFVSNDFTIQNVDCPYPTWTGGSPSTCHFTASLTPTAIGPRSFQMTFGDTLAPTSATVDLAGTGVLAPSPSPGTSTPKPKKCKKKKKHRCKKKR